jgi:hypothetical protein
MLRLSVRNITAPVINVKGESRLSFGIDKTSPEG